MFFLIIARDYVRFHYTTALVAYLRIHKNLQWFLVHYFSIPQLLASLFSPYKRMTESRGALFDVEAWIGFIAINLISRIIGFIIRMFIIVIGVVSLIFFTILSVVLYAVWIASPLLIAYCFLYGIYLLF